MGKGYFSENSPKNLHRFAVFESLQVGNLTKNPFFERPDFQWSKETEFWRRFVKGDENYTAEV